jgi:hypothetical protein
MPTKEWPYRPSKTNWARLAAYIDGEGSICILRSLDKKMTPGRVFAREAMYVSIANTDPRLLLWCQKNFGGRVWISHVRTTSRPVLMWRVHARHASRVLEGCLPFFIIKKEQAEIAIAWQRTRIATTNTWGRKGLPACVVMERADLQSELKRLKLLSFQEHGIKPTDFDPPLKIRPN